MILTDIQAPAVNRTYDFELDEEMPVKELTERIAEIIAEKEEMSYDREDEMQLYAKSREKVLDGGRSLRQQGIKNGEKLYLI